LVRELHTRYIESLCIPKIRGRGEMGEANKRARGRENKKKPEQRSRESVDKLPGTDPPISLSKENCHTPPHHHTTRHTHKKERRTSNEQLKQPKHRELLPKNKGPE
jgi:hypothetical protein